MFSHHEMIEGLILGSIVSIIGAIFNYYFLLKKIKDDYNAKLFFEYKQLSQKLAVILEDLLTISMSPSNYTIEQCYNIDKKLGQYFFKYYLSLPPLVLEEMNCLHACLQCGGEKTFIIENTPKGPLLRQRNTDEEIKDLFMDVAIITKNKSLSNIYEEYHKMPNYINLKCQARHVITVFNSCWNIKDFNRWQEQLPKQTILQKEKSI